MGRLANSFWRALYRNWPLRRGRGRIFRAAWRGIGGIEMGRDDFGNHLLLDLDNFIDAHIHLGGAFEREEIELLRRTAVEHGCTIFVDVGANLGGFTLAMARWARIAEVHAFEPDPRNFAQLEANLFLNGLERAVRAWNLALGTESGGADLHFSEARKGIDAGKLNRGTSGLVKREDRHTGSVRTEVRRLDELITTRGGVIAVKIDVEGFERSVLAGMEGLLRGNRCFVLMEIFEANREAVTAWMREAGYIEAPNVKPPGENHLFVPA